MNGAALCSMSASRVRYVRSSGPEPSIFETMYFDVCIHRNEESAETQCRKLFPCSLSNYVLHGYRSTSRDGCFPGELMSALPSWPQYCIFVQYIQIAFVCKVSPESDFPLFRHMIAE